MMRKGETYKEIENSLASINPFPDSRAIKVNPSTITPVKIARKSQFLGPKGVSRLLIVLITSIHLSSCAESD